MIQVLVDWLGTLRYGQYLQNKYVVALFLMLLFIVGAQLLIVIFNKYLQKFSKKTKTKVDDIIFEKTKRPLFYLILVFGAKIVLQFLSINGVFANIMSMATATVFMFIISRTFDIIIDTWGMTLAKKTSTNLDEVLLPLFRKSAKVIFVIVLIIWVLGIWGINVTPYLAGVGISGLVLGLALQDALKNIFGGVTLMLDRTFQIGDKIKLEDGTVGLVRDIGLRSTKLKTFDNEIIYIPNGYLANSKIQNYTHPSPTIRAHVEFGVVYGTKIEKVKKVVLQALKDVEGIMPDPEPVVAFLSMGDFSLQFKASFWVEKWEDAYAKKLAATGVIYDALNKAKIGIAFPTQTIHVDSFKK